jgi:hypothetical protein
LTESNIINRSHRGTGLASLAGRTPLEILDAGECDLCDAAVNAVSSMSTLQTLRLAWRGLTNQHAVAIGRLSSLRALSLCNSGSLSGWGVDVMLQGAAAGRVLTRLSLRGCPEVGDSAAEAIAAQLPGLESLDLSGCRQLGADPGAWGLESLLRRCRGLTELNISATSVSEAAAKRALEGLPSHAAVKVWFLGCPA